MTWLTLEDLALVGIEMVLPMKAVERWNGKEWMSQRECCLAPLPFPQAGMI
jgi:hypothetical protein